MSYTLIERKELTSAASSISFDNIPQFYSDLMILVSARSGFSAITGELGMWINGETFPVNEQSFRTLQGNGSSASSTTNFTYQLVGNIPGGTATSNTFGNTSIYIPNYTNPSTFKSFSTDSVSENNATAANQLISAGLRSISAAVTSVTLWASTNLQAGSTFSLYGINRQQAIGSPKAVGGAISFANGHWVHTFTGSGTFTPIENLSDVEYLVIAGGAGGGYANGGGGGAGGYRSSVSGELSGGGSYAEPRLSLTASTGYAVTVGAGGAGGNSSSASSTWNGNNSVFSTITSTGGGGGATAQLGNQTGALGGSGGGGSYSGTAGGSGTANQGYAGGTGTTSAPNYASAGGGGSGSAGVNATSTKGGNGGLGVSSSITGSSIARGGGGGGGAYQGSAAAVGTATAGGGASVYNSAGANGSANTGGGGGGGWQNATLTNGGSGGSGIVIIRYKA